MAMKVFLGGTCNNSTWRDELIPYLQSMKISYFNPVVATWTEADKLNEVIEKEQSEVHLYCISKEQKGYFSIFEIAHSLYALQKEVVFYVKEEGMDPKVINSLNEIGKYVAMEQNGYFCNGKPLSVLEVLKKLNERL